MPVGCANHYTTRASRNEFSNVGAIEVGLHATQVPNYCRKWHTIYILVLIHNPLYMSHTTLRWVVNVSSFPPVPLQIEVWAVSNLSFVLLSFAILHSTTEVPFIILVLYFRRSDTLKRVNGDATSAVCRLGKCVSLKHYMRFQTVYEYTKWLYATQWNKSSWPTCSWMITIFSAMWYYLWGVQFVWLNTNDYMMRPLPVSCFVVSFSYCSCQKSAVRFQLFRFDSEVWAIKNLSE